MNQGDPNGSDVFNSTNPEVIHSLIQTIFSTTKCYDLMQNSSKVGYLNILSYNGFVLIVFFYRLQYLKQQFHFSWRSSHLLNMVRMGKYICIETVYKLIIYLVINLSRYRYSTTMGPRKTAVCRFDDWNRLYSRIKDLARSKYSYHRADFQNNRRDDALGWLALPTCRVYASRCRRFCTTNVCIITAYGDGVCASGGCRQWELGVDPGLPGCGAAAQPGRHAAPQPLRSDYQRSEYWDFPQCADRAEDREALGGAGCAGAAQPLGPAGRGRAE